VLDEPDLLVALRRLEDEPVEVDAVDDLVDQAGARLAVGAVHPSIARRPALADDLGRARLQCLLDQLDPAVRRHDRRRVLLADLGEDGEVLGERADQVRLLVGGDLDRPARHLDVLDAQLLQPLAQPVDAVLQPCDLRERSAQGDRDSMAVVEVDLLLQRARHVGRPEPEADQVDVVGRGLHQALRLARREADVDHMRESRFARFRGALRQVEEIWHRRGH
jgi:hypothetical protein